VKILLLEDNKRLNETIVKRLEAKGFEVHSFEDGQEAYNATKSQDSFLRIYLPTAA